MMTRLRYLLTSTVIITTALALIYVAETMAGYHEELMAELETEREQLARVEREKSELVNENLELTKTLQNRTSTLSRGGRTGGFQDMPITQPSGLDVAFFEDAFAGTGLAGIGPALVGAEAETGVNALVLAGIISLESGWGTSALARSKNNLGGLGALDDDPGRAMVFRGREECILFLANLIAGGGTLDEVGRWYASDPAWASKVAGCMKMIGGEQG